MTEQLQLPWHCEHRKTRYVVRAVKGGSKQYGQQCLRCGHFQAVKKTAVPLTVHVVEYDPEIGKRFHDEIQDRLAREREAKNQEWWEWYSEYLKSPVWDSKRRRVLQRDKKICQACQKRKATQVHHLTYERAGDEPLFDLVSVCNECHEHLTELSRRRSA